MATHPAEAEIVDDLGAAEADDLPRECEVCGEPALRPYRWCENCKSAELQRIRESRTAADLRQLEREQRELLARFSQPRPAPPLAAQHPPRRKRLKGASVGIDAGDNGRLVLLIDSAKFAPGDDVGAVFEDARPGLIAAHVAVQLAKQPGLPDEALALLARFCDQDPDGPQVGDD